MAIPWRPPCESTSPIRLRSPGMTAAVLLASSALAVVFALALVREVRLRRALQTLLRRWLERWRADRQE